MVVPAVPVLVLVVMVCALVAAMVARARSISHSSTRPSNHTLSRRRIVRWGAGSLGLTAAVVASLVLGQRAIFLIGPLALSGYVAGLLLGDLMMPHAARGPVRHVSLDRRTISRYVNPTWIWGWRTGVGAASVAIVYHFVSFGSPFLLGLFYLMRDGISLHQLREMIAHEGAEGVTAQDRARSAVQR